SARLMPAMLYALRREFARLAWSAVIAALWRSIAAVWRNFGGVVAQQESVQILQQRLAYEQKLVQLVDKIHSAKSVDSIFIELQPASLAPPDPARMTIYPIAPAKREFYSKFLAIDAVKEIRLPVNETSIAGFAAAAGRVVNVTDAYDKAELARISPTLTFDS